MGWTHAYACRSWPRGHRVELGEIEAVLKERADILDARVVLTAHSADDQRLTAYVVPANGALADAKELRGALERRLPGHMVPSAFVPLPAIPLTPNGKFDPSTVPQEEIRDQGRDGVVVEAPASRDEEQVAEICRELLGAARIGRRDNLFDLGLHSLLAIKIVFRVNETIGVQLPLDAAFEAPTVAGLAARVVAQRAPGATAPVRAAPRRVERTGYRIAAGSDEASR